MLFKLCLFIYMGCCEDYLTCNIAFNAVMPLSRASTRRRYSCIEGVTALSILMGGGQFKKFTAHSSSRVLPLFYTLLRVNIDVKI